MSKPELISTNELRINFKRVLSALKNRRSLVLTYRKRPIAHITPVMYEAPAFDADDSFFGLASIAEPMGRSFAEEVDRILYSG